MKPWFNDANEMEDTSETIAYSFQSIAIALRGFPVPKRNYIYPLLVNSVERHSGSRTGSSIVASYVKSLAVFLVNMC